jgi:hypothetical protein
MALSRPKITRRGLEALAEAEARGKRLRFVGIELGRASYDPTGLEEALKDRVEGSSLADSNRVSGNRVHLTAEFRGGGEGYDVGEMGIVASLEGVDAPLLFAVLSKRGEILAKRIASEDLLFGIDLIHEEIPDSLIAVDGVGERLNLSLARELAAVALSLTQGQRHTLELMRDLAATRGELLTLREVAKASLAALRGELQAQKAETERLVQGVKAELEAAKAEARDELARYKGRLGALIGWPAGAGTQALLQEIELDLSSPVRDTGLIDYRFTKKTTGSLKVGIRDLWLLRTAASFPRELTLEFYLDATYQRRFRLETAAYSEKYLYLSCGLVEFEFSEADVAALGLKEGLVSLRILEEEQVLFSRSARKPAIFFME